MKGKDGLVIGLGIILVVSLIVNVYQYNNQQQDPTEFFNDYVVAVNDYHTADLDFNLGAANMDSGTDYSSTEDYYYEFAIDYYDEAKSQFTDSRELLIHAKTKLENIENKAPNEFYENEVQNRKEQVEIMISITEQYYNLADYMDKQLYEVNYGEETEATRYFNMYNDLILNVNNNLQKLSDVSQEIDLAWDQDWYALMEGENDFILT